nr:MAG TPA: hypothetical protein [Caudoviricetes sp.]
MIYGLLNEWPLGVDLLKLQTFKSKRLLFSSDSSCRNETAFGIILMN